jgi:hypothetical protein
MLGCLKSAFGKIGLVLLLVVAAYGGWRFGPEIFPRIQRWLGLEGEESVTEIEASPRIADSVVALVQEFRRGDGPSRLTFGNSELTSVLQFGGTGLMPEGVVKPQVLLAGGRIHLRARVALSSFPELPDLGPVLGILPDTVPVTLEASVMPYGNGKAALLVHRIEASRIPLPRRIIPEVLTAIGRVQEPGLPPEALLIPLPAGLGTAYILSDSLVLSSDS